MSRLLDKRTFYRIGAVIAVTMLAGCATAPSARRATTSREPLQRIDLPQPATDQDPLTLTLAGEFALADADLASAARNYVKAAEASADPAVASQATRIAIAARQWDAADSAFRRWQAMQPNDPGVWQAHAMLSLHAANAQVAFDDLQKLAQQPDGKGWRSIAQALIDSETKKQATDVLQRLATPPLLGSNAETWIAVSQLAARLGDKALAETLAQGAVKKFASAETYAWAAQLKVQSGDKDGARALFGEALKRDAKNSHLRIAYAALLGQLGDNSAAAKLLAQGPQDDYTYTARAAYAARADDKTLIEPLYRELKALPPPHPGMVLNLLGELAELLERKPEALDWYKQVSESDEHWFEAQVRSVLLLDGEGKTADALTRIHQLQARAGDDAKELGDVYLLEADILHKRGRGEEAVAVYARGLQTLPDDSRLLYARALLNGDLNHIDASVKDLRRLLELKPNDADAMNALGYTLADRTADQTEALGLIEKALVLKPGEPAIMDSLGWVQYRLGRIDEAVNHLRTAFAKQPDPEIAAHLGEVLWVSGQKDEAKKVWEQGRKKDAQNKVLLETIQRLES
ncbi:MAG: tetratricopeptide repeat protein [Rudaea sp.]